MQQQLVKVLKEINPQLNIIVLTFQYPYHTEKYDWFDISVISFNGKNKGGLSRLLLRRKIMATLEKIHSKTPVNALLSFWYGECAMVGHLFSELHGLKHLCWILGQDAKKENKYPGRVQLGPGELIALSDFLEAEFERNHGIKPAHLIPAGIDPEQFSTSKQERDIDILGAGSLIPLKRYDLFIEIVGGIKKRLPDARAVLVGNGPEREMLQELINKSGLETTITITGELPYPMVLQLMQRTKVLLHPSSYEGFSGVCLESLFAGAHVISFCRAMNREIEQWHIVSSKDNMTEKALSILENPLTSYNTVMFYTMNEAGKKMMELFS